MNKEYIEKENTVDGLRAKCYGYYGLIKYYRELTEMYENKLKELGHDPKRLRNDFFDKYLQKIEADKGFTDKYKLEKVE